MLAKCYQKQLLIFFLLVFVIFFSFVTFNYIMDSASYFYRANEFENKLTISLLNKHNILSCANYDERSVQRLMIEKLQYRPQVLILGSSRSMPITHDLFNTSSFYNASVPSATLEDDIALYYVAYKHHMQPETILINLDPWLLHRHAKFWQASLLSEFNQGKILISGKMTKISLKTRLSGFFERYARLFSSGYLIDSVKSINFFHNIFYHDLPSDNVIINPDTNDFYKFPKCVLKLAEGAQVPSKYEESIHADYKGDLNDVQQTQPLLESEYTNLFEQFVQYLVKKDINIIFYLPAYHPTAYVDIGNDPQYRSIYQAENYYRSIAKKYHIKIIGSYNPALSHLSADEFSDAIHLKKHGVDHVFNYSKVDLSPVKVQL